MSAVVIYAKDLERLVAFYAALGLKIDEAERGDFAVLLGAGLELSIIQIPKEIAAQIEISTPPQARTRTPLKLCFFVPSIDKALEATRALGGRIKEDAKRWQFRGHALQDAIDPEGNVYQLRERLQPGRTAPRTTH
jgi:catechol 2,3-dioxygenase-like lactoylglutathione lyase family enzyme